MRGPAERETDTMDGFMESSWYFLRYASPQSVGGWLDRTQVDHFMPCDQYIGGAEHATKHLIYARFFTKMLRDWGWVKKNLDEPFARLLNQGMVCKETYRCPTHDYLYPEEIVVNEGVRTCSHCGQPVTVGRTEKMSKSLKNVVEPLPLIEKYGADTVRVFSLFAAPVDSTLEWSEAGVEGASRFLHRLWRLGEAIVGRPRGAASETDAALQQKTHQTIKKVTEDVCGERFQFNTAIAAIMELVNAAYLAPSLPTAPSPALWEALTAAVQLLSPMAPHLCEEIWERLGHKELLARTPWPTFEATIAEKKRVTFAIQVSGKLRGQVEAEPDTAEEEIVRLAEALAPVKSALEGKSIVKRVFVKGRLLNFVAR